MDNPKIEKVKAEIEKTKAKISEFQAKLRVLERQKTDLENERIVALVRGERISDAELSALMKSLRREEPAEAAASEKPIRLEETRNANFDEN
jgi:septal ring factor EnvC (AmiA/AmiB activator)